MRRAAIVSEQLDILQRFCFVLWEDGLGRTKLIGAVVTNEPKHPLQDLGVFYEAIFAPLHYFHKGSLSYMILTHSCFYLHSA